MLAPGGGKEPGRVTGGCPGGPRPHQGLFGQGDGAGFGARAAVARDLEARASEVKDLQEEGVMEPET